MDGSKLPGIPEVLPSFPEEPKNAWEFYYEQPFGYNLEDIKKAKNVVYASGEVPKDYPTKSMKFLNDENKVREWHEIFKKYIRANNNTQDYIDLMYNQIFPGDGSRVLGVLSRGTDYLSLRPYQHPIQPNPEEIIEKSKEVMVSQNCSYIYLATEDLKIYDMFKNVFGEKLISMNVERFRDTGNNKFITQMHSERENDKFLKGLEYLTTIELLANQCNCLVAGRAGGSVAALILSGGVYDYTYFYDLGQYGIDDVKGYS